MNARPIRHIAAPACLFLLATPLQAGDRVIAETETMLLSADSREHCSDPARLDVETTDPDRLESDLRPLQDLVDIGLQVLTFECGAPSMLRVQGFLRGIAEPVFEAVASRDNRWLLEPQVTLRSDETAPPAAQAAEPPAPGDDAGPTVANLYASMPLPEAIEAVTETFGVQPTYDQSSRRLTMQARGCPPGFDGRSPSPPPAAGWQCLTAWFSGDAEPRLRLLELVQVIDATSVEETEQVLVERFGPPAETGQYAPGARGPQPVRHLAWGQALQSADGTPQQTEGEPASAVGRHELSASIEPAGEQLILVTLTLVEPESAGGMTASDPKSRLTL